MILLTLYYLSIAPASYAQLIDYKLTINQQKVKITDKEVLGLTINNSIPGPTLKAKVGDILHIEVKNNLDTETSIHWHGVLVPNRMDGVPYITTPPIKAGQSLIYEFPVKHSGTYWYHAHSALQEQQGLYGSIILTSEHDFKDYDEEHVIVLSDWTDEKPEQVLANIKKDPDYYALKKDSVQSWAKVLANGSEAVKLRFNNVLNRMGPMDLSDIGYDAFLINGKQSVSLNHAKPGTKIRLRLINAAASSYFILEYSGGPMKVIEADGMKVVPFTKQRIRIAMAETYDVIVTVPDNKTYEFRASAEDGTGYATAHIGHGELIPAPTFPKPNLVLMNHGSMSGMHDMSQMQIKSSHGSSTEMNHSGHSSQLKNKNAMPGMNHDEHHGMQMNIKPSTLAKTLPHIDFLNNYKELKSPIITTFPENNPRRSVMLRLTGSMERYVWTINDTPIYESDKITIKKGESVKFILNNKTMMHHPIHLHGHFFRVLNGQGDYSPLKHTVNVAPFETVEIEFEANEEKDWIFHCHNLYHMKLGMGGIINYEGTKPDHDVMDHADDHSAEHGNQWFNMAKIEGFSNFGTTTTKFMRNNDNISFDARHNYKKHYEVEAMYQRYVSQFLGLYIGGNFKKEKGEASGKAIIGIEYTLPLLIKADLRLNTRGKPRFGLGNQHQLADRTSFDWKWNTDQEYTLGINYALTKQLYIAANYDSREQFGIGLSLKF